MKATLISIKPKWCERIVSGKKTIEVRKSCPQLKTPFKCYIYCTKENCKGIYNDPWKWFYLRGKVIGEFICNEIIQPFSSLKFMSKESCVSEEELFKYSNGKQLYGWRISDLKIYDKPKELGEFKGLCRQSCLNCKYVKYFDNTCEERGTYQITRPPQSWCYVEV